MLTKKKRKNTNKSKPRKIYGLSANHKDSRQNSHISKFKTKLSHLSKNPIKENFEEKLLNEKESYCCDQT
jgi:hypothetical protein